MLAGLLKGLVDIVYPRTCLVCKTGLKGISSIDNLVCSQCWAKIKKNPPPFCHSCGRHLEVKNPVKNICLKCLRKKTHFDRAFSPCLYDGVLKELIHEFKYNGKDYLGRSLSRLMIEFIKEFSLPMDCLDLIVPVPLHKIRLRERDFNQAKILSGYIAREFDKKMLGAALIRNRHTKTQTELEEDLRFLNVHESFSVARDRDIKGANILLVDDVLTTGATSSEAAYTLKKAGANIVFVLTLAN
jgi:competence protein ComFC